MKFRKTTFLVLISPVIIILAIACSGSKKTARIKQNLLDVAVGYASAQLNNPEMRTLNDSTVMVGDTSRRYFIQPSQIFAGLINEDDKTDGIVTVTSMVKTGGVTVEHLIILNVNDKYLMIRSVESEMKILSVKDRVITAQVATHPPTNPLHNCPVCVEVVRYRFVNGDLEKI
jgi:hypothetical protein